METGPDDRTRWALWRFSILGPLVSARLEHGDRQAHLREIAARIHVGPDGSAKRFSRRTKTCIPKKLGRRKRRRVRIHEVFLPRRRFEPLGVRRRTFESERRLAGDTPEEETAGT